ncbi:hypothetical protein AKJ53_00515 [candidate division MSBL1 archaeon SCGC-AAA382F02]|uniref:Glutamyl-tRNA reductase n=1 Tax=candidate division MSBL1 archaeon SCGC-AAA382F02 TaxID=1698282 RepID=A0A133VIW7_9EURY|nr:hypothetical protein AKJ53_00515 [candidate division MSBL1 archaeon SCGC-AAA382F02]
MGRKIKNFLDEEGLEGYVFLQTCNRAEAYFLSDTLSSSVPEKAIERSGEDALSHLLKVASGADSLIVGETEILHQLREAYNEFNGSHGFSSDLEEIFDWALKFGKKVRRETDISSGKTSVVSIGLDHIQEILENLDKKKAVVIGAGKIGAKAARYLKDTGVQGVLVANRTYENAVELAEEINGESYRFSKLPELIRHVEIIVCATGAPHYTLSKDKIPVLEKNKVLLDLSVPRNVHPEVIEMDKIEYISYEELTEKARENLVDRSGEVKKVKRMIRDEVEAFLSEDPLEDLYKKAGRIRRKQLEKAMKELKKRDEGEVLRDFSRSLTDKVLSAVKHEMKSREENWEND